MNAVTHTVILEVLTPVHVGSGDTVNALAYLREGDTLHVVDPDRWTGWLVQQGKAEQFVRWLEEVLQITDRQQRERRTLTHFVREQLRRTDLAAVGRAVARYSLRMEECDEPHPLRGFKTHLRDARSRAYLPGSSLKGAIRTALVEELLLEDDRLEQTLLQPLQRVRPTGDRRALRGALKRVWEGMEQALLRGGQEKANFDLLRFVLVSDGEPFPHEQVSLRKVRSEGTGRPTDTWIEAVRPGATTRFTLSLVPSAPLSQLGLSADLREYLLWEGLFEVLYERAERRLERELAYPYPATVRRVLQDLRGRNRPESPLLCLGWGQGYLGTTVMGLVRDEDAQGYARLIDKMRPVLPRQGQGIQGARFPKTRRAVRNTRQEAVYPPGWVQLRGE
ncbi:hypothetical protein HRbin16_01093 [bacterium HR16]|nr:hypothetical protein HRbin16_01093 [bacterium HR16]